MGIENDPPRRDAVDHIAPEGGFVFAASVGLINEDGGIQAAPEGRVLPEVGGDEVIIRNGGVGDEFDVGGGLADADLLGDVAVAGGFVGAFEGAEKAIAPLVQALALYKSQPGCTHEQPQNTEQNSHDKEFNQGKPLIWFGVHSDVTG